MRDQTLDSTDVPGYIQAPHRPGVHPEYTEEAGEDQVVQVDHLDLRHLKVRTLQEHIFSAKMQIRTENMLNMLYMQYMQNMAVDMMCRICRI